ncbi:MAG: hypothetical protein GYB65_23060 [Chloroflexi bacterium]|nr:hypothetical protein [Chloroflexota bacterium]
MSSNPPTDERPVRQPDEGPTRRTDEHPRVKPTVKRRIQADLARTSTRSTGTFSEFPEEQRRRQGSRRQTGLRPRRRGGCLLGALSIGVVVVALVALALFLPPFSLLDELDDAVNGDDNTPEPELVSFSAESTRAEVEGMALELALNDLGQDYRVQVVALSSEAYIAGETPAEGWHCSVGLPPAIPGAWASKVYSFAQDGTPPGHITLAVTVDPPAEGTTVREQPALYAWNADTDQWEFLPAAPSAAGLVATVAQLPRCVAAFRPALAERTVGVTLASDQVFVRENFAGINDVRVLMGDIWPTSEGELYIKPRANFQPAPDTQVLIQNYVDNGLVVDVSVLRRILNDPAVREVHALQIAAFAQQPGASPDPLGTESTGLAYSGVVIDYRGLPSELRAPYTAFITDLAHKLHLVDRTLAVVLPAPVCDGTGVCTSGGYDWAAIGHAADEVIIAMPLDPAAYGPGGAADQVLTWALTQVERRKLVASFSALSVADQGELVPLAGDINASLFGLEIEVDPPGEVEPGQTVTARLAYPDGTQVSFGRDEAVRTPYMRYTAAGGDDLSTIWITDAAALQYRVDVASRYGLGGIIMRDLLPRPGQGASVAPDLAPVLVDYRNSQVSPNPARIDLMLEWVVLAGDEASEPVPGQLDQPVMLTVEAGMDAVLLEARLNGAPLAMTMLTVSVPPDETPDMSESAAPDPASETTLDVGEEDEPAGMDDEPDAAPDVASEGEAADAGDDAAEPAPGESDAPDETDTAPLDSDADAPADDEAEDGAEGGGEDAVDDVVEPAPDQPDQPDELAEPDEPDAAVTDGAEGAEDVDSAVDEVDGAVDSAGGAAESEPDGVPLGEDTTPAEVPLGEEPEAATGDESPGEEAASAPEETTAEAPAEAAADVPAESDAAAEPEPSAVAEVDAALAAQPLPTLDPSLLGDPGSAFEFGTTYNVNSATTGRLVYETGFEWREVRIEYTPGMNPEDQIPLIEATHGSAVKILFTVVGNPDDLLAADNAENYVFGYASYLGMLALNGADGIQVWSNVNTTEAWPLSPESYTFLLAHSYQAIKTSSPNTLVISGSVVPTELPDTDRSDVVWDDDAFLVALNTAGAGEYMDCVGAQYLSGAVAPSATSGDPRGDSPVVYLGPVTDRAASAFGNSHPVCYTRLGYLTPEGLGTLPEAFAWAQNTTLAQQAEWLASAIQLSRDGGQVRLLIVWKLDAESFDEPLISMGYSILRPDQTCPACETLQTLP